VWSVRCEVRILDNGVNITDAASLCALAALMHFKRPDVKIDPSEP
jgi:exosome complex component RRP45